MDNYADKQRMLFETQRDKWWESLPRRVQAAITLKGLRSKLQAAAKQEIKQATVGGYVCPKCYKRHPTPEARMQCRQSHRKEEGK